MSTCFCFDLDGTVTRREILPAIASEVALTEEIALLTSLTIRGLIPFESSFRLRCRLLREIPVSRVRDIVADIPLDPCVEAFIKRHRDRCAIVTGNLDVWVSGLVDRLGCRSFTSTGLVTGDRLDNLSYILRKDQAVLDMRQRGFTRVTAVGDSVNDMPMLQVADVGVAFGGVHAPAPEVIELADYVVYGGEPLCRLLSTL